MSGVEGLAAYYPLVMILNQIHWELTGVLLDFLIDAVVDVGFLEQYITAIFLICKDAVYGAPRPFWLTVYVRNRVCIQILLYPTNRCAAKKQVVYI